MSEQSGSASRARRFFSVARDAPRTPEPFAEGEARIPSPPRPRFRLKRRNVSQHLTAPTQQFLASVAAADVPIPSIEEPEIAFPEPDTVNRYPDLAQLVDDDMALQFELRGRAFSPPKTPAPGDAPSLSPSRYPNWSIDSALSSCESSPEPESSRPSTSRSTRTSASSFSRLSSCLSEDAHPSLEVEASEKWVHRRAPDNSSAVAKRSAADTQNMPRKASWTKAMSAHLWSTYVMYLNDPTVTPFRVAKNGIPPRGVCNRVAHEAKRSWKGSKVLSKAANPQHGDRKSGSITPTADGPGTFMEWPHSNAAGRAHLRELCRLKALGPGAGRFRYMSRSPTPFTHAATRHWNRRTTPGRPQSAFRTQDMALSLTLSTAEAMQPEGPLAQLTSSAPLVPDQVAPPPSLPDQQAAASEGERSFAERLRLGSPFIAKSYGPSSSTSLAAVLGLSSSPGQRQTHTLGPRRSLQSPVRLSRSTTQKRRTRQFSHEPRKRPTLAADFWVDPITSSSSADGAAHEAQFSSTASSHRDDMFIPRAAADLPLAPLAAERSAQSAAHLAPPVLPPPRLGSPFPGSGSSHSVPNRLTQPGHLDTILGRPFATVQQPSESSLPVPTRDDLASRLAYIDRRLKEFNRRDGRQRSESPF
ncbi:hypothetical protein NKR23_g8063 [Pleurostoma richardsiae]|uniref:Uncharacterized protein n=1 Tax=Pleurostoma richardsiae TaxID=41990 RepID=A0AA38VQ21_9PEZI|nr:hypothetical protein NKR23_g8063 [Pleurostoma richardsiae]